MRRYLLAAVAAAAIATPALARDGSPYVGIEAGILIPEDLDFDVTIQDGATSTRYNNALLIDSKNGLDADIIAGYDFGWFRLEGELAYKRFSGGDVLASIPNATLIRVGGTDGDLDISGDTRIISLMANGLVDIGDQDGWSAYVGAGFGQARVRIAGDRDSAFAKQLIGGVRYALSPNTDIGLKYRYFRTSKVRYSDDFTNPNGTFGVDLAEKIRTHSLLASLIFNFNPPPPPPVVVETPPPPPPPPATQTCYDGSVILATDVCPEQPAPPPPPPPEPAPERG